MNLKQYTQRVMAAARDLDMGAARAAAAEVRALGLDYEADLLLIVYGEEQAKAMDRLANGGGR